jgi:transcriptional regulator with XRE-family HTH domain
MPSHELIKQWRDKRKLTQEELAQELRKHPITATFTPSHISKLERGLRVVKSDEIPVFATVFDCDIVDLHDPKPTRR